MGQKTKFGFVFCAAAGLIASAGLSYADAQAQQGDVEPISVPEPEASADPVFISDEVVQPLPEPEETPAVVEAVVPDADSLSELMANVDAPQTLSDQLECLAGAIRSRVANPSRASSRLRRLSSTAPNPRSFPRTIAVLSRSVRSSPS